MIIVTDELVAEFEQVFDGAISDKSDAELLALADQVRTKLEFDILQEIIPAPFTNWHETLAFLAGLAWWLAGLTLNQPSDAHDLADTQADALGTLW